MARKKPHPAPARPHVALIVETSLISGREILRGISRYIREHGPWSIYHEPRSLEAAVPAWLKGWRGDGIIVRLQYERIAAAVVATRLPAVDVLGVAPDRRVPLIHVDNAAIGRLAAEHLLDRGFRNFGYCGIRHINWSDGRRRAFTETVAARGCQCNTYYYQPALHTRTESSWENQQERLAQWIAGLPKPVGIMACYDPAGQRVLEAARRAGAAMPEEVAVLGVDNDETVCEVCDPPLSSIAANHAHVGYEAAALLDRLMHGATRPAQPTYVQPAGVEARRSTDALALADADVAAALHFIHERACREITVHDVVDHVSISHSALKERFRRLLGRTVHEEIVRTRLKRCQDLLARTDLPLRQVALQTGFRHQEYMGAVFKEKVGKTPGQYRREAQR